jgi:predicted transcriptional regulator of viral defense system
MDQWGVVAHYQLLELGFGARAIAHRLQYGRLHQVHLGVYAVGHARLTRRGHWMAGVLAYGPGAALSHRDAATLHNVDKYSGAVTHVTANRYTRNPRPGLKVHRPRQFPPEDVTVIDNIPVTTLARTFIDLAPTTSLYWLTRMWDSGIRQQILDLDDVYEIRSRSKGRRGLKKIDYLLAQTRDLPPRTRTELERDGYDLFAQTTDTPTPVANAWIPEVAQEVDLLFPHKVVVELDHEEWHAKTRNQRETDNDRDFRLQLAGYRVLRVSDFRLRTDREGVVGDVRDLLRTAAAAELRSPLVLAEHADQPLPAHLLQA